LFAIGSSHDPGVGWHSPITRREGWAVGLAAVTALRVAPLQT